MALDPSIILGLKQPEYQSPINALGNALALQGQMRQNELGGMQLQQAKLDAQDAQGLRNYLQSNPNLSTPEGQAGLYKAAPTKAAGIIKSQVDSQKSMADLKKTEIETAGLQLKQKRDAVEFNLQALGSINDPAQLPAWYDNGVKSGLITPEQAQQGLAQAPKDPQGFVNWKQQQMQAGMTVSQQLEQALKQQEFAYRQKNDAENRGVTLRGQDITVRGQNMVDARARDATVATMTKPFEVTGPDGMPMLVQQDRQGNLHKVEGFGPKTGASKPLTDSQAKALLFGTRAQESDKILSGLDYSPLAINSKSAAGRIPLVGGAAEALANLSLSPVDQQAEQAQRDFINAVLRRESGAVIADSEFANASRQYFPQPGDSKQVLEQKAKNRKLAISGMLAEVPEGRRSSITPAQSGWSIQEVK